MIIEMSTENAKYLKKILEKVFQGRNEFTRPTSDGGREYLTSLEELDRIDEVLVGVIGQLSRGIESEETMELLGRALPGIIEQIQEKIEAKGGKQWP